MAINANLIQVGAYYLAGQKCDQLRKVTSITKDKKGRNRIRYVSKSANIKNHSFSLATALSNPPLEATFAKACCNELNATQVANLRKNNILLSGE